MIDFFLKYLGKYKSNEKIQQKMKVDFQTIITFTTRYRAAIAKQNTHDE